MAELSTDPVEGLSVLLTQWVDEAFPAGERDVVALNRVWRRLAKALCESPPAKRAAFEQELFELKHSGRAGYPPVQALEHRLRELIEAGVRDLFIVVAVRQGLTELIALEAPAAYVRWIQLAEVLIPVRVQWGHRRGDIARGEVTFGPSDSPPGEAPPR